MIEIEKNIPISKQSKYDKYIQAMVNMKEGESFTVNDYRIVDAVRNYGWRKGLKITFRTIAKEKYRIWKL
jgi:hypothetical protein|tara:strand:+ start:50 stop:259 length:210 start_codon:yes stop_codon:yes gene_type:complete